MIVTVAAALLSGCGKHQTQEPQSAQPDNAQTSAVSDGQEQTDAGSTTNDPPSDDATDPILETALRTVLDPIAERYGAVGVQAAFLKNGSLAASYEYGWANKEEGRRVTRASKYRCASLSKLSVAMVTAALADEGKLSWDDDIGAWFGYAVRSPSYPDVSITPRMLLTHTSSIIDSAAFLDSRNSASSTPLKSLLSSGGSYSGARPGTSFSYSNFGVAVLVAAEECLTGERFDSLAQEKLFGPLEMDAAYQPALLKAPEQLALLYAGGAVSYGRERQLSETAAEQLGQTHHLYQGNLTVSAVDYCKLIQVLLGDGQYRGRQILSPAAVAEITGAQFDTGTQTEGVQGFGECQLLHVVEGRTLHCHTGSNFGMYACFAFDPTDGSGIVIFTSGAAAGADASGVYDVHAEMIRAAYETALRS